MPYSRLNADNIQRTLDRLVLRIQERFPERGLVRVAQELSQVADAAGHAVKRTSQPYWTVRLGVAGLLGVGLVVMAVIVRLIKIPSIQERDVFDFFDGMEAALNTLVLTGAGVFFLTTLEERMKRRRVLEDLHELRSLVHVIDMHQLTKDPISILSPTRRTKSSPERGDMTAFELNRYLDYCAELLSLAGKVAALYAQNMRDPVVIAAVNEIEGLATNLSRKIWQKITLIPSDPPTAPPAAPPGA